MFRMYPIQYPISGTKKSFLVSTLMLNAKQEQLLKSYCLSHKKTVGPLRKQITALMIKLNALRNKKSFSVLLEEDLNREIAGIIREIQVENAKYFKSIRLMCSTESQKYFDEISNYPPKMSYRN